MIKKILGPLDRSETAEQALPIAATLASRTEARVSLAAVVVPGEFWTGDRDPIVWQKADEAAAGRYLGKIQEGLLGKGVVARGRVASGPAAETLSRLADEEDADLIVMSTHGRAGFSRWVMGSVADKLMHITTRPLLLVHTRDIACFTEPERLERILVPLDGSPLSESALPFVEELAGQLHASLVLQQAVLPVTLFAGEYIPPTESLQEPAASAHEYLGRIAARERSLGIACGVEVDLGASADAILHAAERSGADIIALSTHGRSGPLRWVLGSVADAVVRHSPLPVLVIPGRAAKEQEKDAAAKVAHDARL
jgi:nucleotide-binding universal stress UspA family protein